MLIDTDVLIWYMRGNPRAATVLERFPDPAVSVITYMELVQGMRNKHELKALRDTLRDWGAPVLPLDERISHRAMDYVERHFHGHALRLADALIGATAVVHNLKLLTANAKHYSVIRDLKLERFRPR